MLNYFFNPYLRTFFSLLLESEERRSERERDEKETLISCLLHMPQPGIELTAWVCALTKN